MRKTYLPRLVPKVRDVVQVELDDGPKSLAGECCVAVVEQPVGVSYRMKNDTRRNKTLHVL